MYASPKNFGQSSLNGIERKLREDSKFSSWRAINLFTSYNGLRVSIDSCFPASPFLTPHKSPPPRNSLPFSCLTTPDCLQFSFRIIRSFVWIRLPRNLNKFHLPSVPISTRDPESFKNLLSRPVFPRIYPSVFASAATRIEHAAKKVRSIGARRNKRKKKKRKKKIRRESDPLADTGGRLFSPSTRFSSVKNYTRLKRRGENRYARALWFKVSVLLAE